VNVVCRWMHVKVDERGPAGGVSRLEPGLLQRLAAGSVWRGLTGLDMPAGL
jgi:hypothetical protein